MQKLLKSLKLSMLHIGYAKLDHTWNFDNVISPFTRMFYVTEGTAEVYHNKMKFEVKPGYIYLIPSYTYNRYKCEEYHEQYYISFFDEVKKGLSIFNLKHFEYEIKASEIDIYYINRLLEIYPNRSIVNSNPKEHFNEPTTLLNFTDKNEKVASNLYVEAQGILAILLSRFIKNIDKRPQNNTIKGDLNKVLIYIAENLHDDLTVKQLAEYCNLSTDYFSRSFQSSFGMRPNKYIQSRRIERAQLLLLTTNNSLKQIAEKVGLENISYFSRTFKNITGKTPAAFRKGLAI